ncbi:unnamed protein product [Ostreobium quekettii]|uniref:Uncharacterized protein n=1 Tax=Ostreobium quekettii TaxID=121088 RepID=A0A8S1IRM3_9CHLO|nr:unnamed protein product [Ostreobium quekettii]
MTGAGGASTVHRSGGNTTAVENIVAVFGAGLRTPRGNALGQPAPRMVCSSNMPCEAHAAASPTAAGTLELQPQEFDGVQYLRIEKVEKLCEEFLLQQHIWMLFFLEQQMKLLGSVNEEARDGAVAKHPSALNPAEERAQALEASQLEIKRLQADVFTAKAELDKARQDLNRAVLIAAEEIEERLAAAWEKEHWNDVKDLQAERDKALERVDDVEAASLEAIREAETRYKDMVETAVKAVEAESEAAINLAQVSARTARESADASSKTARNLLEAQKEAVSLVGDIQQKAAEAQLIASRAQEVSVALRKEVKQLREDLRCAHEDASKAAERAGAAEQAALRRVSEVEQDAAERIAAVEQAYKTLTEAEKKSLCALQKEAEHMQSENKAMATDMKRLHSELSASEAIVAQAQAQMQAMELKLQDKLEAVGSLKGGNVTKAEQDKLAQSGKRIASEEAKWQETVDELASVEKLVARSQARSEERMNGFKFCVTSAARERDYWRARAIRAEGNEKAMQMAMEGMGNEAKNRGLEARRMLAALSTSARRRLYAIGTSSKGPTGGETSEVINGGWMPPAEERGPLD